MAAADGLQHVMHDPASQGLYYDPDPQHVNHDQGAYPYDPSPVSPGDYNADPRSAPQVAYEYDDSAALPYDPQKSHFQEPQQRHVAEDGGVAEPKGAGTICGMKRKSFIILAVAVIIVVVAGAVGGGVGGALAGKNKSNAESLTTANSQLPPSSTTTSTTSKTSTTSAFIYPTTLAQAEKIVSCPFPNATIYTPPNSTLLRSPLNLPFQKYCGVDLGVSRDHWGDENISSFQDLSSTLDSCIDACVNYNIQWTKEGGLVGSACVAVAFTVLDPVNRNKDLRCWLKHDKFKPFNVFRHNVTTDADGGGVDFVACAKLENVVVEGA